MNQLLISVLLATVAMLTGGAVLLLGLITLAGYERSEPGETGWIRRLLCRLSFERFACCEAPGRAG
ncbi:MAG TPA: hypothetical protein VL003_00690 [Pusillimonas sp.]|uniref:hypothetical protein n=1 Tax=Pusillimonas sp. TaxID=3040095 RepID=UPI002B74BD85|nr:hypothetical protein [Pusillimonas sp.]HUH86554.1 hypothetical protein [Pusillimonas sp.]